MGLQSDMTWEKAKSRWRKMYRGKVYTVSCEKLGVPATKEGSYQAANSWWQKKRAEIDGQQPRHVYFDIIDRLEFRQDWCRQNGKLAEAAEWERRLVEVRAKTTHAIDPNCPIDENYSDPTYAALVSPVVAERIDFLQRNGATIPDIDQLDPLGTEYQVGEGKIWDQRQRDVWNAEDKPDDKSVSAQVKAWLASLNARVEAEDFSPEHFANVVDVISKFENFFGGSRPVSDVKESTLEQFHIHLLGKVKERRKDAKAGMSPEYARKIFRLTKQFWKYCWSKRLIEYPRNFDNKFSFGSTVKAVQTMTLEEFRELYEASTGQTRLHLLLMANCGFYPIDISELESVEVDWQAGRIVRKRSKTADHDDVPTVDYKLWPETFELLKKYRTGGQIVLLTKTGQPWVNNRRVNGKLVSCNSVESNYTNLKRKLNKSRLEQNIPPFAKPLSLIRKTSASLIESQAEYGRYVPHFLGHSPRGVADKHYRAPSKELFDEIMEWLGRVYGFCGELELR